MDNVTEGNKLIAEFMGRKVRINARGFLVWIKEEDENDFFCYVNYNMNWDELKFVIEKVHDECKLYSKGLKFFKRVTIFSTIKQVWLAVVEFIKWYNNQKIK